MRGRWTWAQRRKDRAGERQTIRSKPDYVLARHEDRGKIRRVRWVKPRRFNSDHRALVFRLRSDVEAVDSYKRKAELNPLLDSYVWGPLPEGEAMFEELRKACQRPERRELPDNAWIRPGTWSLIDRKAELRKANRVSYSEGRKLGRKIRASLKADKIERARRVGEQASIHQQNGEVGEAFRALNGWYREAGDRAPKPCYQTMEDQTVEREKLYDYVKPPGEGIPSNIERPAQDNFAPSDEKIRRAVRKPNNGRAGALHFAP